MTTKQRSITIITTPQAYPCLPTHPALAKFDPELLVAHCSDEHLVVIDNAIQVARCSLWWTNSPWSPQGRTGLIGHYAATDAPAAGELLNAAIDRLTLHGCSFAVAPVDQHTWRDYRLAVTGTDRPRFLFEPYSGDPSPVPLAQAGFRPIAWYFSALVDHLTATSPRVRRAWTRLQGEGITLRPIRQEILEQELRHLHYIADAAFGDNPWYIPISADEFVAMYGSMQHQIPLEFTLIAEDRGNPIGFCFAVPDLLQRTQGKPIDTLVIKTLGVVRERRYAGLGQVLLEDVQQRAAAAGMNYAIHALVRETANLQNISRRYAKPFRRYALYGRELTS